MRDSVVDGASCIKRTRGESMDGVTPGVVLVIIIAILLVIYFVVRAAASAVANNSRDKKWEKGSRKRAGGLYLDNLGRINEGLGVLSHRSDSEKERLRELKKYNESLGTSNQNLDRVVAELEKINDEVRSF